MNTKMKSLFRYILPALGGLFVTYLYNVVDGIFVGQGVGSAALGAVNIGVPFVTFVVVIAAMFPMGGATVVAIRMGRGDRDGAKELSTEMQEMSAQYLFYYSAFSIPMLMSICLYQK